jgi:hypothetical protein
MIYRFILLITAFTGITLASHAQDEPRDTFFLSKKKGILGRIAKSITTNPQAPPVKIVNPYKEYAGMIIRNIMVSTLSFNENINDTNLVKNNFALRVANFLHKNTKDQVVRNNLFFHKGEKLLPLLVADNERYLRDLTFVQDARIIILPSLDKDSVDLLVLTKDVFSIGAKVNLSGPNKAIVEVREDNIHGSGSAIAFRGIFDRVRNPQYGYGANFTRRNIKGTFFDWTTGFETFNPSYSTGRREEVTIYTRVVKPFVSRFAKWTGALDLSYNKNINVYNDASFSQLQKYTNERYDIWAGYNLGYKKARKRSEAEQKFRSFIAVRGLYVKFDKIPLQYKDSATSSFVNINGGLFAYTLYKQNFYRTNYIYGFGRNEDVPTGLSTTLLTGWTNKAGKQRKYYGVDAEGNYFSKKGYFGSLKFKTGGYAYRSKMEDITLLLSGEGFTKLKKVGKSWFNRNFVSMSFARLFKTTPTNEPLYLQSQYGLPYFTNSSIVADARTSIKFESVFFNTNKVLGFRFAPFIFSEFSFINALNDSSGNTNGYSALGGGIRSRNENLIFGTIELKGYYFPRTIDQPQPFPLPDVKMKSVRIELSTKLTFKFNSTFIKRPDLVVAN